MVSSHALWGVKTRQDVRRTIDEVICKHDERMIVSPSPITYTVTGRDEEETDLRR